MLKKNPLQIRGLGKESKNSHHSSSHSSTSSVIHYGSIIKISQISCLHLIIKYSSIFHSDFYSEKEFHFQSKRNAKQEQQSKIAVNMIGSWFLVSCLFCLVSPDFCIICSLSFVGEITTILRFIYIDFRRDGIMSFRFSRIRPTLYNWMSRSQ